MRSAWCESPAVGCVALSYRLSSGRFATAFANYGYIAPFPFIVTSAYLHVRTAALMSSYAHNVSDDAASCIDDEKLQVKAMLIVPRYYRLSIVITDNRAASHAVAMHFVSLRAWLTGSIIYRKARRDLACSLCTLSLPRFSLLFRRAWCSFVNRYATFRSSQTCNHSYRSSGSTWPCLCVCVTILKAED